MEGLNLCIKVHHQKCEDCRFKNTCIDNLEEDRIYVITEVKDI